MAYWKVTTIRRSKSGGAYYPWSIDVINTASGQPVECSWHVPDLSSPEYDLTEVVVGAELVEEARRPNPFTTPYSRYIPAKET